MAKHLLFDIAEGIATITLNRPDKRNALSPEMIELFVDALERARVSDDVDVIVITGAGDAFCFGGDVSRLGSTLDQTPLEIKHHFFDRLHRVPKTLAKIDKPVIAAVNGIASGAGVDVALQADIRFAAQRASFHVTYTRFGLVPGNGGTYFLPRLVGDAKALELFWSTDPVDADEALRIGLVNKVFPDDEILDRTMEWARKVREKAPIPVRMTKRMVRQGARMDLESSLDMISSHMVITRTSRDHAEGIAAYQEKRKPKFEGR